MKRTWPHSCSTSIACFGGGCEKNAENLLLLIAPVDGDTLCLLGQGRIWHVGLGCTSTGQACGLRRNSSAAIFFATRAAARRVGLAALIAAGKL
jgi:hypothetical protein